MFIPQQQTPSPTMTVIVRSTSAPAPVIAAARRVVADIDRDVPLADVAPMSTLVSGAVAQPRLTAQLVGCFALLALLLAAIGIHAVLAFTVAQRTREIGTRVALGASARDVIWLVVWQSLRLVVIGCALGLVASFEATKFLSSLLIGTSPRDPVTFAGVAIVFVLTGFAAAFFPARRASQIDPLLAMRES